MQVEVIKATINQKSILANLLELYTYEFTEFLDFDLDDDGYYGYDYLPLYWTEPNRYPFLIYVDKKLAGFALIQKGSPISDDATVWDMSEFFVIKKYQRCGVGTIATDKILKQFKGPWQIRVLVEHPKACSFWLRAIRKFNAEIPKSYEIKIEATNWLIYTFESN